MFNPFPNKPFLCVCSTSLLKTLWEKDKLLVKSNFSFSHSVFNQFGELCPIFTEFKIVIGKSLSTWKGLKFLVRERVNQYYQEYWPSWRSNQPPPILKSHLLLTEPHKLGIFFLSKTRLTTGWSLHQGFVRSRFVPRSQPFHLVKHRRAEV